MPVQVIVQDKVALSEPCLDTIPEKTAPVIQDLMDTVHYQSYQLNRVSCAGLAANQIGSDMRVFVVKVMGRFIAFINPSFSPIAPKVKSMEGCLSFPGKHTEKMRHPVIMTSPPRGKRKGIVLKGIAAIAFQHELDHLNGVTI